MIGNFFEDFREKLSENTTIQQYLGVSNSADAQERIIFDLVSTLPSRAIVISLPRLRLTTTPGGEIRGNCIFELFFLAEEATFSELENWRGVLVRPIIESYQNTLLTIESLEAERLPEDDVLPGWWVFSYVAEGLWRAD